MLILNVEKKKVTFKWAFFFFYLIGVLAVLTCCEPAETIKKEKADTRDTVHFQVEDAGKLNPMSIEAYLIADTLWLTVLNNRKARINVLQYDQEQQQVIDRFKIAIPKTCLARRGISAYYIQNRDSIFILADSRETNPLCLINDKSQVIKEWEFTQPMNNGNRYYNLWSLKLLFSNNMLVGRLYRDYSKFMKNHSNPSTSQVTRYSFEYPSHFKLSFQEPGRPLLTNPFAKWPAFVEANNKIYEDYPKFVIKEQAGVIAFLYELRPLIQLYDLEEGTLLASKRFDFKGYQEGLPLNPETKTPRLSQLKSSAFNAFKQDFAQDKFYAVYMHPLENQSITSWKQGSSANKKREVLVFDDAFELKKRLPIPDYKRYYAEVIKAENGFFLVKRKHDEKFTLVYVRP